MKITTKQQQRYRRHIRFRSRVQGTSERPRMSVYRSLTGMYVQLVDDTNSKTLASIHNKTIKTNVYAGERKGKTAVSYILGKQIGEKAKELGIISIVFDRGGFTYQGRVQALAEGARDAGLKF